MPSVSPPHAPLPPDRPFEPLLSRPTQGIAPAVLAQAPATPGNGVMRAPRRHGHRPLIVMAWLCALLGSGPAAWAAPGDCEAAAASAAPGGFVGVVERNAPALVHLLTVRERSEDEPAIDYENVFPMQGAGSGEAPDSVLERVTASGFVLSPEGEIVTSAHAVRGRSEVWAALADGRHLPVRVIGIDRRTDVALLKVEASGLPVVRTAPDAPVCAGQWVAALGAPFGFERSITAGVVSAAPRALFGGSDTALIQMNVALNPGSSGGPLFNSAGEVIGMNAMIYASEGFYVGISFALPIGSVLQGVARVRAGAGRALGALPARTQAMRPDLARAFGLPAAEGVLIVGVDVAAHDDSGLRRGDVLLALDERPVPTREALDRVLAGHAPGAVLAGRVWRAGRTQRVSVRLGEEATERSEVGAVSPPRDPLLGLRLVPAADARRWPPGAYVDSASGTGLLAGLDSGDRIVAVNGTPVANPAEFEAAVRAATADVVALLVTRGPITLYVAVARPAPR